MIPKQSEKISSGKPSLSRALHSEFLLLHQKAHVKQASISPNQLKFFALSHLPAFLQAVTCPRGFRSAHARA
jgi:hypothetical protein